MATILTHSSDTTPGGDSVVYAVDDPSGSPVDTKIALSDLGKGLDLDVVPEGTTNKLLTASERSAIATNTAKVGVTDELNNIVEDATPQLGGNLDLNGNNIVTTSNGDINLLPNGTGKVVVDGNLELDNFGAVSATYYRNGPDNLGVALEAGDSSASTAGNTMINGGDTSTGTGGDVIIKPGAGGSGTAGKIKLQHHDGLKDLIVDNSAITATRTLTMPDADVDLGALGGGGSSPLTTKGDVYTYSTADARLPVGTDGQVLTADSAESTGIKWATPSGGGGAPTPRFRIPMVERMNPLDNASDGMTLDYASGTGASASWNTTTGLQMVGPSSTTGYARYVLQATRTSNYIDLNFYSINPSFTGAVGAYIGGDCDIYFGLGGNGGVISASFKGACFYLSTVSGTTTVYARTSDGTSVTDTDITSAAAATDGWNIASTNWLQFYYITVSASDIKFYINGTLMATHTTNLPSGALVANSHQQMIAASVNANGTTAASSQFNVTTAVAEVDLI